MREIKFRAWDKECNNMIIEPSFININGDGLFSVFVEGNEEYIANDHQDDIIGCEWISNSERIIIMQYTGLKDKNGKEVFEGDIIIMNWDRKHVSTHEIQYFDKWGMFGMVGRNGYGYDRPIDYVNPYGKSGSSTKYSPYCLGEFYQKRMEVIGNIYENGDFIK